MRSLVDVHHIFREVTRFLDETFSFADLVEFIEQHRGHELCFETCPIPLLLSPTITAFIVPLRDCDLICTRVGLDVERKAQAQLHEMGHLLSGDIDLCKDVSSVPTKAEFLQNTTLRDCYIQRLVFRQGTLYAEGERTAYDLLHEQQIETLATLLKERIEQYHLLMPPTVQLLYGYQEEKTPNE